jgi:hypothetical protein
MGSARSIFALLLAGACSLGIVSASGCGTEAIGVSDCRDIEQARCSAGSSCGLIDDPGACERFYRDACLHGLSAEPPKGASVGRCVEVIRAAGRCAEDDSETPLEDCGETVTDPASDLQTACDVVRFPERAPECAFLSPEPEPEPEPEDEGEPDSGEGGSRGEEAPAGGAGGAGGAAG